MHIIGVDCAVSDNKTGFVQMHVDQKQAELRKAEIGSKHRTGFTILHEWITETMNAGERALLCLDAPLGWPKRFGERLSAHEAGLAIELSADLFFRRRTDNFVYATIGKRPLDVTANFIARTAFRALELMGQVQKAFPSARLLWDIKELERVGWIEVYPAAWLQSEAIPHKGYKIDREVRQTIADCLQSKVTMSAAIEDKLLGSEHLLDAALCCMSGLDFMEDQCIRPSESQIDQEIIRKEGWVWIKK